MPVMNRGPYRHMDVLAGIMHSHARQRHPVYPADQAADPHATNVNSVQTGAVTLAPDNALGVGGHQLAMNISQLARGRERQQSVVKSASARPGINALVDAYHNRQLQIASGLA